MVFLVTAKVATVAVALLLKRIIDAFAAPGQLAQLPVHLLAGYAILRFLSTLFNELRDLLFARFQTDTTPRSVSAASCCPAAKSSASRSRAPSSRHRQS